MKLEQQDDLYILTVYCFIVMLLISIFVFNKYFSNMFFIILQKLRERFEIFLSIFIVQ